MAERLANGSIRRQLELTRDVISHLPDGVNIRSFASEWGWPTEELSLGLLDKMWLVDTDYYLQVSPPITYHVTDVNGLKSLSKGGNLQSPAAVKEGNQSCWVGKGVALEIIPSLLAAFGVDVDSADNHLLFGGRQIDADQIAWFKKNAGETVGSMLTNLTMVKKDDYLQLNPHIRDILVGIESGLKTTDPGLLAYIDHFLFELYQYGFVREGHLDDLRSAMNGDGVNQSALWSWQDLSSTINNALFGLRGGDQVPLGEPVVLKINTSKLISRVNCHGLIPVHISRRVPWEIQMMPIITPDSVEDVYANVDGFESIVTGRIEDLAGDEELWLSRTPWSKGYQPDEQNPLCGLRYGGKTWHETLKEGELRGVPLNWIGRKYIEYEIAELSIMMYD